jgi:hypothetical protein
MGDFRDNRPPSRPPGQPGVADAARPERLNRTPVGASPTAARPTAPVRDAVATSAAPASAPLRGKVATTLTAPAGGKKEARGRIVHDERGNAVWDWLKETSRIAIESTSRLLRKLELPELQVEDTQDEELRLESDRDPGGGYDPYNQRTPTPRKDRK